VAFDATVLCRAMLNPAGVGNVRISTPVVLAN
jgi:hypothetical protein